MTDVTVIPNPIMWSFSGNQSWALNQISPNLHLLKDCSAFQIGFIDLLWNLYPSMRHFPKEALVLDKDLDLPTLDAYLASQTVDMFFFVSMKGWFPMKGTSCSG